MAYYIQEVENGLLQGGGRGVEDPERGGGRDRPQMHSSTTRGLHGTAGRIRGQDQGVSGGAMGMEYGSKFPCSPVWCTK